jgi:hypothetical protein
VLTEVKGRHNYGTTTSILPNWATNKIQGHTAYTFKQNNEFGFGAVKKLKEREKLSSAINKVTDVTKMRAFLIKHTHNTSKQPERP